MTDRERAEAAQNHDINDDDCRKHGEPLYSSWCKVCAADAITAARVEEAYKAGTLQGVAYRAQIDADVYRARVKELEEQLRWVLTAKVEAIERWRNDKEAARFLSSYHSTTCICNDCQLARKSAAVSVPVIRDPNFDYDDVSNNARLEDND
jgi:hypothetical protein